MSGAGSGRLIPARPSDRFFSFFARYVRRLLRRRFHSVRIARDGLAHFEGLSSSRRPTIVLLSHSSWWDPLVATFLSGEISPRRPVLAPMDREQLERFRFFRRIGMFGIDPDDPESLEAMRTYVIDAFRERSRTMLWLTPQGRFTDVRDPVRIRPGAAAIASMAEDEVDVCSIAIEYVFWQESRAEVLVRCLPVERPERPSTSGWHRAMTATMQSNADALAGLARAREEDAFSTLVGDRSRTSFFYDLMLRLRGRGGEIAARRATDKEASGA
jgi:1-acyl-sn-glycerol-3-phosphate acyltransferase